MRAYLACLVSAYLLVAACSSPSGVKRTPLHGGSGGSGGQGYIDPNQTNVCDPTAANSPCGPNATAPPGCGDGILTQDEACDDANRDDSDGCWGNCLGVDPGYSCQPPGEPCHEIARCGDGVVSLSEPCDDGNVNPGEGCSNHCKLEIGFKCEGSPSVCSATTCGDSILEGAESCDDGNNLPFDGCSATCQAEPNCSAGACTSECGDGLVLGEDCDDGNRIDGDGCSASCTVETGFMCPQGLGACEMVAGACVLRVPVIYRDFNESHSDFQVSCGGEQIITGVVQSALNASGKPELAPGGPDVCIASASSFAEWYTSTSSNATIGADLVLYDNGDGGFVNRWGPNGEQWLAEPQYVNVRWCGPAGTACGPDPAQYVTGCTLAPGEQCWDPCNVPTGSGTNSSCAGSVTADTYDGTPLFFPLDGNASALSDTRYDAKIPPSYGYNWKWEDEVLPMAGAQHVNGGVTHNFHFTTEVNYWFQYAAAGSATLDFTGDDDVWVFVNGKLAVDLGGLHPPVSGSVTINAASAASYGLEDGKVYKITVFHAERKIEGSSFRLTLAGFSTTRSDCQPVCGDGVVGLGEECDDGLNDGGYGECDAGCVLGAYCGDGTIQEGEDCDDGNRIDGDACGSACRVLIVK